jgi:MYXO-CTERM domain-containing protein
MFLEVFQYTPFGERIMKRVMAGLLVVLCAGSAAQAVTVTPGNSSAPWLGYMNVYDLGNNFQFGTGWGVADLRTTFNDAAPSLTMLPNTIGDPNPYWYTPSGGPGSVGNKIMEANLYMQESNNPAFSGQTVNFTGFVTANSLTTAHQAFVFIRDFAPDFSSVNETIVPLSGTGSFNISLATIPAPGRHVQYGFQMKGVNSWITEVAPFGSITYSSVPTPGALALAGMGGLIAARRRRA